MKETSRKSNIAYKERVGMKCYKATKQMLLSENEDLRERIKHLEDKLKEEKIKSKIAEVDKVTASEPPPAAGLALQENPDSGVETEDELVVKPKKRKNQMQLQIARLTMVVSGELRRVVRSLRRQLAHHPPITLLMLSQMKLRQRQARPINWNYDVNM